MWREKKRQEPARFKYTADRATIGVEEVFEYWREGAAQRVEAVNKQGKAGTDDYAQLPKRTLSLHEARNERARARGGEGTEWSSR